MGWYAYNLYGGDDTQTRHLDFIKWSGIKPKNGEEIFDWLLERKTKIPKEYIPTFIKGIPKILKRMSKSKFFNEDNSIEWQMLAALFIDNKLKIPTFIKNKAIDATNYLLEYECDDFDNPSKRRYYLKSFIKKLNN